MEEKEIKKGEIIIYKTPQGPALDVKLEKETVWLTQEQISRLFGTQRPAITKHLKNIFEDGELKEKSACSILEHTAKDGKTYQTQFYNLDAIVSVGYRVNSKSATQFRIWATRTLKEYLIKGYAINKKRLILQEEKLKEVQQEIRLLQEKSKHPLLAGQEQEILNLLADYSKTLTLLEGYDKKEIILRTGGVGRFVLTYEEAVKIIIAIKKDLLAKKQGSQLFGQEPDDKLKSIIGNIYQSLDGKGVYPSFEEKAAHLLYFAVKDHPFVDGNKRIASFLFVYLLDRNQKLYNKNGERKINDNALTILTLLIAASSPSEKDILIKLITNLISN
jgi:prophage maintenance system killer protein